jgi:hypothetical protein
MEIKKVQLNLYILEIYRNMLTRMAAERMMKDPSKSVSASQIGAEIICGYLDRLGEAERSNKK